MHQTKAELQALLTCKRFKAAVTLKPLVGGISSVGRASALHAEGQEFKSPILHQYGGDRF